MINQSNILDKVHERIDKVVPRRTIHDILSLCVEYIVEEIEENRNVSIDNFGTFSVATQICGKDQTVKIIKLRPTSSFKFLLKEKKENSK